MRILVTGGTGLVGREACHALRKQGHDLVVLTRNPEKAKTTMPFAAEFVRWEATKDDGFELASPETLDAVLNLAGDPLVEGRWTEAKKVAIHESRGPATERLIQFLKSKGCRLKVFVSASAMGIYGQKSDEHLSEDVPAGSGFLADVCKEWEKPVLEGASGLAEREVRLRISLVLSARGGFLGEVLPIFSKGLGGPIADGQHWMSWIHIDDLVQIISNSLQLESYRGAINTATKNPVKNKEMTETLGKVLGRPALFPVPKIALRLAFGEKAEMLFASYRLKPEALEKAGFVFEHPRLEKALQSLGI